MSRGFVTLALATLVIVGFQLAIVSPLRVGGVVVMVVWLWPLVLGLTGSTAVAVVTGFASGLLFDVHTITPLGLTGVVGALLAWAISMLAKEGVGDLDGAAFWVPPLLIGLGGLLAPLAYVTLGAMVGQVDLWRASLVETMLVNFVVFLLLARPLGRVAERLAQSGGWART